MRILLFFFFLLYAFSANAALMTFEKIIPDHHLITLPMLMHSKGVISFWRSDCAPCVKEIQALPEIATLHPAMRFIIVSLHNKQHTLAHLPKNLPDNIQVITTKNRDKDVLKSFRDQRLSLPYSVMMRADGSMCAYHYGILNQELVGQWSKLC